MWRIFVTNFVTNFCDEFFGNFLAYNIFTLASFRIGVPSILFFLILRFPLMMSDDFWQCLTPTPLNVWFLPSNVRFLDVISDPHHNRSQKKYLTYLIDAKGPFIYYVIIFLGFLDPPPPLRNHVFSTKNNQKLAFSDPPPPLQVIT